MPYHDTVSNRKFSYDTQFYFPNSAHTKLKSHNLSILNKEAVTPAHGLLDGHPSINRDHMGMGHWEDIWKLPVPGAFGVWPTWHHSWPTFWVPPKCCQFESEPWHWALYFRSSWVHTKQSHLWPLLKFTYISAWDSSLKSDNTTTCITLMLCVVFWAYSLKKKWNSILLDLLVVKSS